MMMVDDGDDDCGNGGDCQTPQSKGAVCLLTSRHRHRKQ